jgi:hypothetical protein
VSPVLRGLLGLDVNAIERKLTFAPHVPADWQSFSIKNVPIGDNKAAVEYKAKEGLLSVDFSLAAGGKDCEVEFRPAISPRAKVQKVELDGAALPFHVEETISDQHVIVNFRVGQRKRTVKIYLLRDFGLSVNTSLPGLGSSSEGLRMVSENWSAAKDQVTLEVAGLPGKRYALGVRGASQLRDVVGGELSQTDKGTILQIPIPLSSTESYSRQTVTLHFQ